MDNAQVAIDELISEILKIPGDKIVTLVGGGGEKPLVIDINEAGIIGYEAAHQLLFKARLAAAFAGSGGAIIRQFLPIKVERVMPNGKKMWIPRKNIYGVSIIEGSWQGLTQEEVKQAHCTDSKTGKPIPAESDVLFRNFPDG